MHSIADVYSVHYEFLVEGVEDWQEDVVVIAIQSEDAVVAVRMVRDNLVDSVCDVELVGDNGMDKVQRKIIGWRLKKVTPVCQLNMMDSAFREVHGNGEHIQ